MFLLFFPRAAPEVFLKGRISVQADVWSFGIVLFELFTYGSPPYPDMSNEQVKKQVPKGYRLTPPTLCGPKISELMLKCWELKAKKRPTFQVKKMELKFCKLFNNF